eukprot:9489085-Pyramimonas_sp.AAC.1
MAYHIRDQELGGWFRAPLIQELARLPEPVVGRVRAPNGTAYPAVDGARPVIALVRAVFQEHGELHVNIEPSICQAVQGIPLGDPQLRCVVAVCRRHREDEGLGAI